MEFVNLVMVFVLLMIHHSRDHLSGYLLAVEAPRDGFLRLSSGGGGITISSFVLRREGRGKGRGRS